MCFIKDDWLLRVSGEMPTFHMEKGFDGLKSSQCKQKSCRQLCLLCKHQFTNAWLMDEDVEWKDGKEDIANTS